MPPRLPLLAAALCLCACPKPADDTAPTEGDTDSDSDTDTDLDPCAITTLEDGLTPSQALWVSTTGSDTAGDGSEKAPFATLQHALGLATPGSAVWVLPGTYEGGIWVEELHGEAASPIWVGGVPGQEKPVLSGGGTGLQCSRCRYVILHNLEVSGASDNGLNFDDGGDCADETAAHHLLFRDLYVHDIGTGNNDCLKLSGVRDYMVLDSVFSRCGGGGSGSGVDQVGCHHGLLARNSFTDLSANAVQAKGGSTDLEIRWNLLENSGERGVNLGGNTGFEYFRPPLSSSEENAEARDIRVLGNLIVGGVAAVAYVGCVDCVVAHNTLVDPESWIFRILQETTSTADYAFEPARRGAFHDNLVYYDLAELSTWVNVGPDTEPESFAISHNLWYAHDQPASSAPSLPVAETDAVIGQDPGFLEGYAIDGASPAARAGVDLDLLTCDIAGTPFADPPSIGAWEVAP